MIFFVLIKELFTLLRLAESSHVTRVLRGDWLTIVSIVLCLGLQKCVKN